MWQAEFVASRLMESDIPVLIVPVDTTGDKVLDVSISKIGSKGVFTEELEQALADGSIDMAVHSAKDLESTLGEGFEILAFTRRENACDVLVSHKPVVLEEEKLLIGTASTRRIATLRHHFPQMDTVPVRGNLQTRIKKMESGVCDALLLAYAGVHRMGYDHMIRKELPLEIFTPAVGQGSLAIEIHKSMPGELREKIRQVLNDNKAEVLLTAERAFLKKLQGGCSIPAFAYAKFTGETLSIRGGIYNLDGTQLVWRNLQGRASEAQELGTRLASDILHAGGDKILQDVKSKL